MNKSGQTNTTTSAVCCIV